MAAATEERVAGVEAKLARAAARAKGAPAKTRAEARAGGEHANVLAEAREQQVAFLAQRLEERKARARAAAQKPRASARALTARARYRVPFGVVVRVPPSAPAIASRWTVRSR